jgi:nanoRNase/pAp phosphatase (c-di-AMP/oligoRNAs hydrolase)
MTHAVADFDSLAAAVGLAKVWQAQEPDTKAFVVGAGGLQAAPHSPLWPVARARCCGC